MSQLPTKELPTSELVLSHDVLLVCVDDTGHELLAPGHSFYGLGGCAVLGSAGIRLTWDSWHTIIIAQKHLECSPLKGVALEA